MLLNGMLTRDKIYSLKKILKFVQVLYIAAENNNFFTKIFQIFIKYLTFFQTNAENFACKLASFNAKVYTLFWDVTKFCNYTPK